MALLETHGLTAFYGDFQALFGVDITLDAGATVAIIGANGAGKTTLLRAISGVLASPGAAIQFDGEPVGHLEADDVLSRGIAMVPEGRKLFPSLSVEENLLIGAHRRAGHGYWSLDRVYELFPILAERRSNPGTALSGGQQQMVAIGRGLMSEPKVLILDEPSLGLSPLLVERIFELIKRINETGLAILLVEQNVIQSLAIADRAYVIEEGAVSISGKAEELRENNDLKKSYLGL